MSDVAGEATQRLTGMLWGLSTGFMSYVTRMNGAIRTGDDAGQTAEGAFVFPVQDEGDFDPHLLTGTLRFGGVVSISAHHGMMNATFAAPWLVLSGSGAVLSLAAGPTLASRVDVADIALPTPTYDGTTLMWGEAPTRLLESGRRHFGDVYPAGEPLAPVSARILWAGPSGGGGSGLSRS